MGKQIPGISRRRMLAMTCGGIASLSLSNGSAVAADKDMKNALRMLAGKIFYSTDRPGRWKGKEQGHSPLIKIDKQGDGVLVRAATRHPMSDAHYIVKHMLMDAELNFIGEQFFDKQFDMPRSRFELNGYKGRIFIVSMCNQHDNWINWADV